MIPPIGNYIGHGLIKIICFPFVIGIGILGGLFFSIHTLIWYTFNKMSLEETYRQVFAYELFTGTLIPIDLLQMLKEYIHYLIYDW